jgi:pimeloyl-ACP methyl ester carboxylesterase
MSFIFSIMRRGPIASRIAAAVLCWLTLAGSLPTHAAERASAPGIDEGLYVAAGGIEHWVSIKGADRKNPVILFLHGGPGNAWSPFAEALFAGWEKNFILVQWDQRGAGRTYGKHGPGIAASLTVERMVEDGVEISEFLRRHLNKKKIIIVGGSWGSVLGVHMAQRRPDLFHAYVGFAQVVNMQTAIATGYARLLEMARAAGDQAAIAGLSGIGPPPWDNVRKWPVYRKWQRTYQAKLATAPAAPFTLSADYASPAEQAQYEAGEDFSFEHFWGMTLKGPLMSVDLPALGPEFRTPIFMFQGEVDLTAAPELAKAYFDRLNAPRKQFTLVPGTGHEPSAPLLALMHEVLARDVRAAAMER